MSTAALPQVKPGTRLARVRPRREPLARGAEQCRVAVDEAPGLAARKRGGKRAQVRAGAAAEVDDRGGVAAGEDASAAPQRGRGLRARWSAGSRSASHSALNPLMPPPASAPPRPAAAVSLQRGSAWPAAQDASAKRRRSCASAIMSASAAASAAASPGGTLMAAASGTVSAAAPPVVATIGRPARHRLGQDHAVALEERRRDEDVGAVVEPGRASHRRRRRRARCGRRGLRPR